ncbi:MAG: bestrophin family ion channel [Chitinophagaceae bacterium]|jgi:putative membrane protein
MLLNERIPAAYILKKIRKELIYVLAVSLLVLVVTERFHDILPEMPLTIPAFIGTAISVLLSFKLSQSYDRWWEARKIWGAIVNDSRSLLLQLKGFVSGNDEAIKTIAFRQIAWCYCLGNSLRGLDPLVNMENYISKEDLNGMKGHANKPLSLLQFHARDIKALKEKGQLELFSQIQLDTTLVRLCDSQGKAERIKSTVFPITYRIFLHSIIYLFVVTLSIALNNVAGYFEIPLLVLISSAFFLLEKTATHMQDPFENRPTDTAVTAITRTIEINLKELLGEENIPKPIQPEKFYQL